jgi:hypothetical protein
VDEDIELGAELGVVDGEWYICSWVTKEFHTAVHVCNLASEAIGAGFVGDGNDDAVGLEFGEFGRK